MVEHMECPQAFLGKLGNGTLFFSFPLRTALVYKGGGEGRRLLVLIIKKKIYFFSPIFSS